MFDYRALYEIQLQVSVDFLRVVQLNAHRFIQEIQSYDIVFLSETHTGFDTHIDIEGFQHISVCRPLSRNNRYYCGLALLIRKSIRNGIKIFRIPVG